MHAYVECNQYIRYSFDRHKRKKIMTLGNKIKSLRTDAQLSQDELAEKLSVSRQALSKWENDLTSPDIEKIKRISDIFDVSIDYLLKDNQTRTYVTVDKSHNNMLSAKTLITVLSLLTYFGAAITVLLADTSVYYVDWSLTPASMFGIVLQLLGIVLFIIIFDTKGFEKKHVLPFWLINLWPLSLIPHYIVFTTMIHRFTIEYFDSDSMNTTLLFQLLYIVLANTFITFILKRRFKVEQIS